MLPQFLFLLYQCYGDSQMSYSFQQVVRYAPHILSMTILQVPCFAGFSTAAAFDFIWLRLTTTKDVVSSNVLIDIQQQKKSEMY